MRSCPPGPTPLLTDLESADRSSGRQCRLVRQFLAGSRRLKDCSSITVFGCCPDGLYVPVPAPLAPPSSGPAPRKVFSGAPASLISSEDFPGLALTGRRACTGT